MSSADISQLLHLHPLTLEDILQRDPREKLELFPKLGYYFISFRAIEGQNVRDKRMEKGEDEDDRGSNPTIHDNNASLLGEANVYLVVFNEGICTVSVPISHHRVLIYSGLKSFTLRIFQVGSQDKRYGQC